MTAFPADAREYKSRAVPQSTPPPKVMEPEAVLHSRCVERGRCSLRENSRKRGNFPMASSPERQHRAGRLPHDVMSRRSKEQPIGRAPAMNAKNNQIALLLSSDPQ